MTTPLLYVTVDTDCGGEEESGWIQTVADDEDARERQKGGAAL